MILIVLALTAGGLALWAAAKSLRIVTEEARRSEKQRAAMIDYVDTTAAALRKEMDESIARAKAEFADSGNWEEAVRQAAEEKIADAVGDICAKMSETYFANDFNATLGNILGFDPYSSLKAQRDKERKGER